MAGIALSAHRHGKPAKPPAVLLSGVVSPIRAMPPWLQAITWVNPVRHYAELMRSCLMRGAGFADLAMPLAALAVLGSLIFAAAALRFNGRTA